jgi:hypothetical protein
MPSFVPLLVAGTGALHDVVLSRMLRMRELRPVFVRALHDFLALGSSAGFAHVSPISETEPVNDIDDDTFAYVVSALFLWFGFLYSARNALTLIPRSQYSSAIAADFDLVVARTPLAARLNALVDASSSAELLLTVRYIASILAYFSLAKIGRLLEVVAGVVGRVDQGARLAIGLLAAHLHARFASLGGEAARLGVRFRVLIVDALKVGDADTRAGIVAALVQLPEFEAEVLSVVYAAAVDGIQAVRLEAATRQAATAVVAALSEKVGIESIEALPLIRGLRYAFDELPFDSVFLRALEVAVGKGVTIEDFNVQSKLSIEGLFGTIGNDEKGVIGVLRKISGTEDVASGLQSVFNARELAQFALTALKVAKQPLSTEVIGLLCSIGVVIGSSDDRTASTFRKSLIATLLPVAENKTHEARELALGTIKALVH